MLHFELSPFVLHGRMRMQKTGLNNDYRYTLQFVNFTELYISNHCFFEQLCHASVKTANMNGSNDMHHSPLCTSVLIPKKGF